jgi:hypothetical protein
MKMQRESQKEPDMKTRRSLFTRGVLSLAALVSAAMTSAPVSAQAALSAAPATSISAATTTSPSTSSTTTKTSTAALVAIRGIVSGQPESVSFSGQAQVSASVVTDPDFGSPPTVVLSIDLSNVTGVGSSSGKTYVVSSKDILDRRLSATDTVQINFPFYVSGASPLSASVGMASFDLSYDTATLRLTGASGAIASPPQ